MAQGAAILGFYFQFHAGRGGPVRFGAAFEGAASLATEPPWGISGPLFHPGPVGTLFFQVEGIGNEQGAFVLGGRGGFGLDAGACSYIPLAEGDAELAMVLGRRGFGVRAGALASAYFATADVTTSWLLRGEDASGQAWGGALVQLGPRGTFLGNCLY